jgi:Protein of unknown function (DUF3467)
VSPAEEDQKPKFVAVLDAKHEFYANFFNITTTFADIHIGFGKIPSSLPVVIDEEVVLALPTAKQLHEALGSAIADYERNFGKVKTLPILSRAK